MRFDLELLFSTPFCLLGLYLMWEIPSFARGRSREGPAGQGTPPRVSVVIPARDEEGRIGPLLESLQRQGLPPHEVIVVDDHSSDRTAALARQSGAAVLPGQALPAGWNGKPWACWQGAQQAGGELLLFLDADVWLEPDGLEKIVLAYQERGGLLTVQPYHVTRRPYEELSAFFNVVLMAGMNAFTPHGEALPPRGAFGPCVACSRSDYFRVGGHRGVRDAVLESIPLAELFLRHDLPVRCYGGRGAVSFRMYPGGLGELVEGWSKGFGSGALSIHPLFLLLTIAWISAGFSSFINLFRQLAAPAAPLLWLLLYACFALQTWWMLRRIGSFRWWTALFFPLPLTFFGLVMLRSLVLIHLLRRVTWKGRTIPRHGSPK